MPKKNKLQQLADLYGYDDGTQLIIAEAGVMSSIVPAICTNEDCDYTAELEPDQSRGWCEVCETNSVQSCLVMAGMI